jgi:hypothetical protein
VIATVALVFAATGAGYAAHVASRDSVVSTSIRDGQVKTRDIGTGAVDARRVRDNSLGGADIDEAKLGTVPFASVADAADTADVAATAATADAVSGMRMAKILYRGETATPAVVIFQGAGLSLTAACSAANELTITASTAANDAIILHGTAGDIDFDMGEAQTILAPGDPAASGEVSYVEAVTGRQVAITYGADEATGIDNADCVVTGVATASV